MLAMQLRKKHRGAEAVWKVGGGEGEGELEARGERRGLLRGGGGGGPLPCRCVQQRWGGGTAREKKGMGGLVQGGASTPLPHPVGGHYYSGATLISFKTKDVKARY